jgi:hypothetical protein
VISATVERLTTSELVTRLRANATTDLVDEVERRLWLCMPDSPNPSGQCMCGCGQATPIAKQSNRRLGHVAGQHVRYIGGHNTRKSPVEYLVTDCGYTTPCWIWQRAMDGNGYGSTYTEKAHRMMYRRYVGAIPTGLDLDHLCRQRACVNPAHLEPVTRAVNTQRGVRAKLSQSEVDEIRVRWATGETQTDIARRFKISSRHTSGIVRGVNWADEGTP